MPNQRYSPRFASRLLAYSLVALGYILGPTQAAFAQGSEATSTENVQVRLETSLGEITLALDAARAPATVENFVQYVRDGHYDGLIFHRVIKGFMVQGGGFEPGMKKRATRDPIENESENGLRNRRGTIAMARTSSPHSATAQFFINVVDNGFLDRAESRDGWGYCVFGQVSAGMDVVDKILQVATTRVGPYADVPSTPIIIKQASLVGAPSKE